MTLTSFQIELLWYAKKKHAEIVFRKCLRANKLRLAMLIAEKYDIENNNTADDLVTAIGLALMNNPGKP